MKRKKILEVSWKNYLFLIDCLITKILKSKKKFTSICGIPRGGLIPAVIISHRLGLPLVRIPAKGTLIVDDISDTGKTFSYLALLNIFLGNSDIYTASIFIKEGTSFTPEFTAANVNKDTWVKFPYEVK